MKKLHYINYYIHWVAIWAIVLGLVGEVFEDQFRILFNLRDMGLFSTGAYLFLFFYQFISSLVSSLKYRKESVYFTHLLCLITYIVIYTIIFLYGLDDLIEHLGGYAIRIIMMLLPSLALVLNYYYITYSKLNPSKTYNNEKNQ